MNGGAKPIHYWAAESAGRHAPPASMFTGPERIGCATMVCVVLAASVVALGIVTALAWLLA